LISDQLLEEYIERFFGYGNLSGPIWYVGMEEGGEANVENISSILERWVDNGKTNVHDIAPAKSAPTNPWFNQGSPPIQPTWGKLIRSALHAIGEEVSNESIRRYQANRLARDDSETCLIELMPLPSKSIETWTYDEISDLSYLKSRKIYMDQIAPARKIALARLIKTHRPKIVVFYSSQYLDDWIDVVGAGTVWMDKAFGKIAKSVGTTYYCVPHPTSYGVKNSNYDDLGQSMREAMV